MKTSDADKISSILSAKVPLPVRMRPANINELVGQDHLLEAGSPLNRLIAGESAASVVLYGPPGSGKTTLASLISQTENRNYVALSALTAGVKEVRAVIEEARQQQAYDRQTVLFIDEVHRFSKNQQDALLAAVENRVISLVAATTENPAFSIVSPLLSRSLVLQLKPITPKNIKELLNRAIVDSRGLTGTVSLDADTIDLIVRLAAGDARRALTVLEVAALSGLSSINKSTKFPVEISLEQVTKNIDKAAVNYDRQGDQHYDVASAFIKSIRGSDPDAAIHYLAKMIVAGEDPRFIARRLIISASEDIGLADPKALEMAVAAAQAVQLVGLPEARINLAEATIYLALAPKSNSSIMAIDKAMGDIKAGKGGMVPSHLRDGHYSMANDLGNAVGYKYPHGFPAGVVAQQYPPDDLVGKNYYNPSEHGFENNLKSRIESLRSIIRARKNK